jgi:hypothetical protein
MMNRNRKCLAGIVGIVVGLAPLARGADGDLVGSTRAGWATVDTYKLCDGATGGATKQCAAFDLSGRHAGVDSRPALPDAVAFSFRLATGCSGATTVMPQGSDDAGLDPRYELLAAALAKPATSIGKQSTALQPVNRYATAAVATGTDCSDLEVYLKLFYFTR